jgi:hypothetical protein
MCHGSLPSGKLRPKRAAFVCAHSRAPGPNRRSAAKPFSCIDDPGGATHLRAAAADPYFCSAASHSCCCRSRLRVPEVIPISRPDAFAAPIILCKLD